MTTIMFQGDTLFLSVSDYLCYPRKVLETVSASSTYKEQLIINCKGYRDRTKYMKKEEKRNTKSVITFFLSFPYILTCNISLPIVNLLVHFYFYSRSYCLNWTDWESAKMPPFAIDSFQKFLKEKLCFLVWNVFNCDWNYCCKDSVNQESCNKELQ